MEARKIKDLAIALEALTRVQGVESEFNRVKDLLQDAIYEMEIRLPKSSQAQTSDDDDIPF